MKPETEIEEAQNEDMNAFVDLFERFDDVIQERLAAKQNEYISRMDRIALFGIYVSRIE